MVGLGFLFLFFFPFKLYNHVLKHVSSIIESVIDFVIIIGFGVRILVNFIEFEKSAQMF